VLGEVWTAELGEALTVAHGLHLLIEQAFGRAAEWDGRA
jgi:hypothetical protein